MIYCLRHLDTFVWVPPYIFFYVQATYYDHTKISLTDGQNRIYSGTNCMYYYTNAPVTTLYGNLHTQKYQNHIFSARSEICKSWYKILDECLRAIHTYIHTYKHTYSTMSSNYKGSETKLPQSLPDAQQLHGT